MTIEIEAVWKHGKIIPLEKIEIDENTKVTVSIPEKKGKKSLAGAWKDYKSKDGKTLNEVAREIYGERKVSSRKEVSL